MPAAASPDELQIRLTEKAARVIHEAFEAEKVEKASSYVRIGAHPGGCSGYKYDMDFADQAQVTPEDRVFTSQGIQIVVDQACLTEVLGSLEIDYKTGNMVDQGFVFRQLGDGGQCGCGESFTPVSQKRGA